MWNILHKSNGNLLCHLANKNSSVRKTKQNRLMLLSNCTVCGMKKSTFIKNKEIRNFNNISNE